MASDVRILSAHKQHTSTDPAYSFFRTFQESLASGQVRTVPEILFFCAGFIEAVYYEDQITDLQIDQSEDLPQFRFRGLDVFLGGIYLLSYLESRIFYRN